MNIPCLYPSSVAEIIRYGVLGIQLSRFSGAWIGVKITAETADSSCSLNLADVIPNVRRPKDFQLPPGGLNLRVPDHWNAQVP
jgi:indolepyruvate ferredoxin oxidoreductase